MTGSASHNESSRTVLIFVPAYNCEKQIGRVLAQLDAAWVRKVARQVIVVDNCSRDNTFEVARQEAQRRDRDHIRVVRNAENLGLGGSHKAAFTYARANGFDWIMVLHGDDQGSINDYRAVFEQDLLRGQDAILGSRFMPGSRRPGYSAFRIFGNHVFNLIYGTALRRPVHDLGAGLNLFRVAALPEHIDRAPDDLTFNCVLLCLLSLCGAKIRFYPISWREDGQVSNVKLARQSLRTLVIAIRAAFERSKFLSAEHRQSGQRSYPVWPA